VRRSICVPYSSIEFRNENVDLFKADGSFEIVNKKYFRFAMRFDITNIATLNSGGEVISNRGIFQENLDR
jgi:hypothetical protein